MRKIAILVLAGLVSTACTAGLVPGTATPRASGQAPTAAQGQMVPATPAAAQPAPAQGPSAAVLSPRPPPTGGPAAVYGLTVVGEGNVRGEPDIAYLTTGVQTRNASAQQAQQDNNATMARVLDAIKKLGVADADIRTSGVNLQPNYGRTPDQIEGYTAINSVTITVQDVKRVGEILDTAVKNGANQAGNVQFGLKDDMTLRRRALEQAVKAARSRADAIASAAGVQITGIVSLVDESGGAPVPLSVAAPRVAGAPEAAVPIQPGQLTVAARVQVVYSVQ